MEDEDILQNGFDEERELGAFLFEYDDSTNIYTHSTSLKKALKSPITYYFMAIMLFLLGSIIFGAVSMPKFVGIKWTILIVVVNLFVFAMILLIVLTTVFGWWGKILRFGMRNPEFLSKRGIDKQRQQEAIAQMKAAESNKASRNSLTVYENYVEVVNRGYVSLYKKEHIKSFVIVRYRKFFRIKIISNTLNIAYSEAMIPDEFLGTFIRATADISTTQENGFVEKNSPLKVKEIKYTSSSAPSIGSLIGITFFLLLPIGMGIFLIAGHYYINPVFPVFLGIVFIIGGFVALCGLYSFIPFVKHVLVPMAFGVMFTLGPVFLLKQIYLALEIKLTVYSYFAFTNPVTLGFSFIISLGFFIIAYSIRSIMDYILYIKSKNAV